MLTLADAMGAMSHRQWRIVRLARRTYTVQWSTEKAGDYLITAWLEECEVGGCAKACGVQVGRCAYTS